jgi:hypothetical protein
MPGKRPPHSLLVRLQLLERRLRNRPEHHVMVGQVNPEPVEAVRDRRAGRTACRVVGSEHEVMKADHSFAPSLAQPNVSDRGSRDKPVRLPCRIRWRSSMRLITFYRRIV